MNLIKYCKKEHNILNSQNILIGTLFKYKKTEIKELLDKEEGEYNYIIEIDRPTALTFDVANTLLSPAFHFGNGQLVRFPGETSAYAKNLEISEVNESSVIINKATIEIKRTIQNCLIFCMSISEDSNQQRPFDGYDDSWSIDI